MKKKSNKINYGASKKDMERGYSDGEYKPKKDEALDEEHLNSMWKDWDDGGFLGRPKGGE